MATIIKLESHLFEDKMNPLFFIPMLGILLIIIKCLSTITYKAFSKTYSKHVVYEGIEKKAVDLTTPWYKDLFSVANVISIAIIILGSWITIAYAPDYIPFYFSFMGMMCVILIGYLIGGLLIYRFADKHPEQISGQVHFKSAFAQIHQLGWFMQVLFPLIAFAVVAPSQITLGALTGMIALLFMAYMKMSKV